jgi:hypothetical protein
MQGGCEVGRAGNQGYRQLLLLLEGNSSTDNGLFDRDEVEEVDVCDDFEGWRMKGLSIGKLLTPRIVK